MNTPQRGRLFAVWIGVALPILGCAAHPDPGDPNGPLSFRLEWNGPADLDLHVRSPLGKEIWYVDPRSPSGGALHVDCNVEPDEVCEEPAETIKWPPNHAPPGTYEYWVRLMHPRGSPLPIVFSIEVLRGDHVLEERDGEIGTPGQNSPTWTVTPRQE